MRAAAFTVIFGLAGLAVLLGSSVWAWASEGFWRPVPLYPAVVAAALLAAVAVYARSTRVVKAAWLGSAVGLLTLTGTAIITLVRWEL